MLNSFESDPLVLLIGQQQIIYIRIKSLDIVVHKCVLLEIIIQQISIILKRTKLHQ